VETTNGGDGEASWAGEKSAGSGEKSLIGKTNALFIVLAKLEIFGDISICWSNLITSS
jgi:hypothetical protein